MISIQILIYNNETTILGCLDSLKFPNYELLIGDLGGTDQTVEICKAYGGKIFPISKIEDYSSIRNFLTTQSKNDLQFYLEPYEILQWQDFKINHGCKIPIKINNLIFYETRFWCKQSKYQFKNPVFESIYPDDSIVNDRLSILSKPNQFKLNKSEILKTWLAQDQLSSLPDYYLSYEELIDNNFDKFKKHAQIYLFKEEANTLSKLNLKYYLSKILFKEQKIECLDHIIDCLMLHPEMAEFWCLLADVYYFLLQRKDIAKLFYQHAITAGECRLQDGMLFDDVKYNKYPLFMINNIGDI